LGASAEYLAAASLRKEAGTDVETLTWSEAFLVVERLVGQGKQSPSIRFSGGYMEILMRSDSQAPQLWRRLGLRPQHKSGPLGRLLRPGSSPRFAATTFVPSLLTFLDRPCRIALVADAKAEALRTDLAARAPWHDFVVTAPTDAVGGRFDIVLSDAEPSGRMLKRKQAGFGRGLVIVAPGLFPGHGLSLRPVSFRQLVVSGAQASC
jgi:hypothetical protein